MVQIDDAFESTEYLASWASEEATKFAAIAKDFFAQSNICARFVEFDTESGKCIDKIRLVKPLPRELRGLASNVIKNYRDALDQLTFAATLLIRKKRSNRAHFPFGESPSDLEKSLSLREAVPCQGLPDELFPILRSCEPYPTSNEYPGGNDALRALGRISGNNKHAITLTVIGSVPQTWITGSKLSIGPGGAIIHTPAKWDAAKNEMKLFSFEPGGYVKADIKLAFSIVFGPGPLEGANVIDFFQVVDDTITIIIDRIKETTAHIIAD